MALSIRKVNADVVPQSKHAGRTRQHNDFDDYMKIYNVADWTNESGNVEWDGWNAVDFDSDKTLAQLNGQLTAASNHAEVGIERRVDNMAHVLYFRVKTRTLKPRKAKGNGTAEGTVSRTGTVAHPSNVDNWGDAESIARASNDVEATVTELEHVADSDSPKRERKAS